MAVVPVACLADNYAYAVFSEAKFEGNGLEQGLAIVVDPSEAGPLVDFLDRAGLRLGGLLLTHHHWDHVGGIAGLRARYGEVPVFAHRTDGAQVRGVTRFVVDGERIELQGLAFDVMHVPGHTLGAVAYRHETALFTGDTLFASGCGRLFEGTASEMYASLGKLAALAPDTEIYCGHEYALRNLAFARAIEPGNPEILERIARVQRLRDSKRPSVPSTLREELLTNPFLRCNVAEFRKRAGIDPALDGVTVFADIRSRRDEFQA